MHSQLNIFYKVMMPWLCQNELLPIQKKMYIANLNTFKLQIWQNIKLYKCYTLHIPLLISFKFRFDLLDSSLRQRRLTTSKFGARPTFCSWSFVKEEGIIHLENAIKGQIGNLVLSLCFKKPKMWSSAQ